MCGSGIVDAAAAVEGLINDVDDGEEESGLYEADLSGPTGDFLTYSIDVPSGASTLNVSLSGGRGDADLYVRAGRSPTTRRYTCRSWNTGNSESCVINNPTAGTWYIGVNGYTRFFGVTLEGNAE